MVSLVFTVLNEAKSIRGLLDTIAAQTRLPDEVVVCDGGSRDNTVAILRAETRFPIRVIEAPGANISKGRNIAIANASHDLIACTDAGVRLDPHWLERLVTPFEELEEVEEVEEVDGLPTLRRSSAGPSAGPSARPNPGPAVSAGFFLPDAHTTFEIAMSATVLPAREDIRPETFLPSSRSVAFRKGAWQAVGGYPEWLDYCEDLIFDLKLREKFGAFSFAPGAIAYFRPRGSLRSFFKQYYLYARGDGKSGLFLKRHLIRYATYLVALPLLLMGILVGALPIKIVAVLGLMAGAVVYTRTPFRRLRTLAAHLRTTEKLKAMLWVPMIRITGDVAKMVGYPVGLIWRVRKSTMAQS